jgi:hypothetical protein
MSGKYAFGKTVKVSYDDAHRVLEAGPQSQAGALATLSACSRPYRRLAPW